MEDEKQSEIVPGTDPETITKEPSQENTVEAELRREQAKSQYTEEEKAAFNLKKNFERVKELNLDPEAILGIKPGDAVDKDQPLTVGMLEQLQKDNSKKTAIQKAEEITDPHERELTKIYLESRIVPSGDADEDLRMARALVNSVKNGQIAQLAQAKTQAKTSGSAPGAPAKVETPIEMTAQEKQLATFFKLTPEQVEAARQK